MESSQRLHKLDIPVFFRTAVSMLLSTLSDASATLTLTLTPTSSRRVGECSWRRVLFRERSARNRVEASVRVPPSSGSFLAPRMAAECNTFVLPIRHAPTSRREREQERRGENVRFSRIPECAAHNLRRCCCCVAALL
ncbi:hypothetical protein GQ42DRAFT_71897 [Ramicandelaber brevisporus]|nr:hypothetical protein GQ42DRAFT_71897 [Ramicandelaber brevisporus]